MTQVGTYEAKTRLSQLLEDDLQFYYPITPYPVPQAGEGKSVIVAKRP